MEIQFSKYGSNAKFLDILINNAGNMLSGNAEETTIEQAKQQFETNFWGTVRVTKAILPYMRKRRVGGHCREAL